MVEECEGGIREGGREGRREKGWRGWHKWCQPFKEIPGLIHVPIYLKGFPSFVSWLRHCSTMLEVHWFTLLFWYVAVPSTLSMDWRERVHVRWIMWLKWLSQWYKATQWLWLLSNSYIPQQHLFLYYRRRACDVIGRQFLHPSIYVVPSWEAMNREIVRAHFEVRSMHFASTLYYESLSWQCTRKECCL